MHPNIKDEIIRLLVQDLSTERDTTAKAAETAHAEATHPEAKPENKYDTRSLEASYLAGAQLARVDELTAKIEVLRAMHVSQFTRQDAITPSAIIQLESEGKILEYFLTAWVSGYSYKIDGHEIRIISAQSPVGIALSGKMVGDFFSMTISGKEREFEILNIL